MKDVPQIFKAPLWSLKEKRYRKQTIINESGLYEAIFGSKKPEAEAFRKWIKTKVLPSIRKTGKYNIKDNIGYESNIEWEQEGYAIERLLTSSNAPDHIIQIEKFKHVYKVGGPDLREVVGSLPCSQDIKEKEVMLEPTELGKVFEISAQAMNKKIAALGLQTKETGSWEPTNKGISICTRHSWIKEGKSGYNYKWNKSKIEELIQEINN